MENVKRVVVENRYNIIAAAVISSIYLISSVSPTAGNLIKKTTQIFFGNIINVNYLIEKTVRKIVDATYEEISSWFSNPKKFKPITKCLNGICFQV